MLINELIIYIELHKTGCTHTRDILQKIPGFNPQIIGKHTTYDALPKEILAGFNQKLKIGNIRNPWDWYISLWSFGCMGKGMLYRNLKRKPYYLNRKGIKNIFINFYKKRPLLDNISLINWEKLYSDPDDKHHFRKWLKVILKKKNIDLGEGYKNSSISTEIGLLSFRYIQLYTYNGKNELGRFNNYDSVYKHDYNNNFMDIILKNEKLHHDLLQISEKLGCHKNDLEDILKNFQNKTNSSNRNGKIQFYDAESIKLVEKKEKLIIQKYSYRYPW